MGLVNMLGIVMILVGAPTVGKIADWTGSFQASFAVLAAFNAVILFALAFMRGGTFNLDCPRRLIG